MCEWSWSTLLKYAPTMQLFRDMKAHLCWFDAACAHRSIVIGYCVCLSTFVSGVTNLDLVFLNVLMLRGKPWFQHCKAQKFSVLEQHAANALAINLNVRHNLFAAFTWWHKPARHRCIVWHCPEGRGDGWFSSQVLIWFLLRKSLVAAKSGGLPDPNNAHATVPWTPPKGSTPKAWWSSLWDTDSAVSLGSLSSCSCRRGWCHDHSSARAPESLCCLSHSLEANRLEETLWNRKPLFLVACWPISLQSVQAVVLVALLYAGLSCVSPDPYPSSYVTTFPQAGWARLGTQQGCPGAPQSACATLWHQPPASLPQRGCKPPRFVAPPEPSVPSVPWAGVGESDCYRMLHPINWRYNMV